MGGGSGDGFDELRAEESDEDHAKFVQELEDILCDQANTGIEGACEAVFSVKVLLALESKYSYLVGADADAASKKMARK
jgi:hypothetical protein